MEHFSAVKLVKGRPIQLWETIWAFFWYESLKKFLKIEKIAGTGLP